MRDLFVSALAFVAAFSIIGSAVTVGCSVGMRLANQCPRIAIRAQHERRSLISATVAEAPRRHSRSHCCDFLCSVGSIIGTH